MKLATHLGATHFPDRCGVMALSLHNLTQVLHQLLPNLRLLALRPLPRLLSRVLGQGHVALAREPWRLPGSDLKLCQPRIDLEQARDLAQALLDRRVQIAGDGRLHEVAHHHPHAPDLRTDLGVANPSRPSGVAAPLCDVRIRIVQIAEVAALRSGLCTPPALLYEREPAYWSCGIKGNQQSGNVVACYQAA